MSKSGKIRLPSLTAVRAERCRKSFYYFVQQFWSEIIAEDPVWNWHIEYLCDELQKVADLFIARKPKAYDLVINVPPGSTKSTICSQMFLAWVWAVDPSIRFITGSYAQDLSLEQAVYTRDIVQSDKYRQYFPEVELVADKNQKHNYKTGQGGQRFSASVGGAVMGIHAHCIIVDDPLNPKKAASEAELKTANAWMDGTLSTRKVDKAVTLTILIMQRLHEDDCSGHILSNRKNVRHICLPAEDSANVNPPELKKKYRRGLLDPIRLSRDVLNASKTELGSYGYAGQMQQNPVPEEGGILKRGWFSFIRYVKLIEQAQADGVSLVWNFSVDTAYTESELNDPSGMMSWCYFRQNLYIRHCKTALLEQPDLEAELEKYARDQGYTDRSRIYIEPKANGISTAQNMRRRTPLNVVLDKAPTTDKVARTRDTSPFVESGRVFLIGTKTTPWIERFLDEVTTFPNAKHDECVDMLNIAHRNREAKTSETISTRLGGGEL